MPTKQREAVGLFHDAEALKSAADAMMQHGFDRADLSVLSRARTVVERLYGTQAVAELEDDPKAPTAAYASGDSLTELRAVVVGVPFFIGAVAAGGAIAANDGTLYNATIGALIAGGLAGVLGLLVAWWLGRQHAAYVEAQLEHGGLLLWVRTLTPRHEALACRIMEEHQAADVHLHDLPPPEVRPHRGKVVYGFLEFLAGVRPPAAGA